MNLVLGFVSGRSAQRCLEVFLIVVILLIVFSLAGVPMILLSTSAPSFIGADLEQNNAGAIDSLDASVAA
jgi:hypothetical protein